jgi:hypothetical protein
VSSRTDTELIRSAPDFDPFHLTSDSYRDEVVEHFGLS